MMNIDEQYMSRCIELAKCGIGNVAPNPMVGAVIVCDGKIIGEGYHRQCGQAHAEVNAVNSVADQSLLSRSTIYVSLEPCAHFGKTPPCCDLIIEKHIPNVVVGCVDSFSKVSGRGIAKMRDAGINVKIGVLEQECRELNRRFFTFHEKQRPYIILKWAQTRDGFIDMLPEQKSSSRGVWITDDVCKTLVHRWRTEEPAILVGTNTAAIDNPQLNARNWCGKSPVRIVLDRTLRLSHDLNIFDGSQPTIVYTEKSNFTVLNNVEFVNVPFDARLWQTIFADLHSRNIQSIIVEGGRQVLQSIIEQNLWDEARVFVGDKTFCKGIGVPAFPFAPIRTEQVGSCWLGWYWNI